MADVVIVEAVRSPIGRRGGGLSTMHPADLLGTVQKACVQRAGIDPAAVDQVVANRAWEEGRYEREVVPIDAPVLGDDGKPTGDTVRVARDEGLRETSVEKLAALKPVAREDGIHTAGTSSQISDGAAAVLLMSAEKADALGLRSRAVLSHQCLVGVDPVLMLTGPIDATHRAFERSGLSLGDVGS